MLRRNEVETISTLEFEGPITPGGPNVTLSGTAKTIYKQIIALNPSYHMFAFPANAAALAADGLTRENIGSLTTAVMNPSPLMSRHETYSNVRWHR
ncbi:hypothetical protein VTL71DRAFT_14950 [Oculimacula yallundae]|uniref:Uncharacterized protein n=1 Tax=Oculimacula yallundae TaxID=86028 RepID=A0ABR4CF83_9HELO